MKLVSILSVLVFFIGLQSCKKDIIDPVEPFVECDTNDVILNEHSIEGYADRESYFPGDSVYLKIHSNNGFCDIEVSRHGENDVIVFSETDIAVSQQNYNCRSYSFGCNWETTYAFKIEDAATSGIYTIRLFDDSNNFFYISFVVKGIGSETFAVIANTNTWEAYNGWGGHSFYQYDLSEQLSRSEIVSFDRPNIATDPSGTKGHLLEAELHLLRWMETKGYGHHLVSDRDLHDGLVDLSNYETVVLNVHPEYWTKEMRVALAAFVEGGGNIINLGANAIYWKTGIAGNRIEKRVQTTTFYLQPNETGGLWKNNGFPESDLLGVAYDTRGYNTYHPYEVKNANHWVFNGTGLVNDNTFGEFSLNGGGSFRS